MLNKIVKSIQIIKIIVIFTKCLNQIKTLKIFKFFENSPGRLKKYIELLTLKDQSTPYATTDKKSLREVG